MAPPSPTSSTPSLPPSTTPISASLMPTVADAAMPDPVTGSASRVTTLMVDVTTTLADSLIMVFSGTPETSTSGKFLFFYLIFCQAMFVDVHVQMISMMYISLYCAIDVLKSIDIYLNNFSIKLTKIIRRFMKCYQCILKKDTINSFIMSFKTKQS